MVKSHQELDFKGLFEEVIIDEMWSWVGKRKAGKRNDKTRKKLIKKLKYLTINKYCTDDWVSCKKHIPSEKHIVSRAKTQKIERKKQDVAPIKFSYTY